MNRNDIVAGEQEFVPSSGDPNIDRHLGRALLRLAQQFRVYPGFGFYDDGTLENAYATRETHISGTNGTVLFGLNLLSRTLRDFDNDGNGMVVIAICAHEFAHIYQYETGYYDELTKAFQTVKLAELQADYLAGFFFAGRKASHPELDLQGAGALIERLGDTEYTNRTHHGTHVQRVAAIEEGFEFGKREASDVSTAAQAGKRFVLERFS